MSELEDFTSEQQELDPVGESIGAAAQAAAHQLVLLSLWEMRRRMLTNPGLVRVTLGVGGQLTGEYTILGDQRDPYNGVAVFNPTSATLALGFEAGGGLLAPVIVPPFTMLALPERFTNLSLALPYASDQQQSYLSPVTVLRLRVPPEPNTGPYGDAGDGEPTLAAHNPGSQVVVGTAGVSNAVAANPARRELLIVNATSTGWITVAYGSQIPAMYSGVPLAPSGGVLQEELYQGPVSIVAASNGTVVSITEV